MNCIASKHFLFGCILKANTYRMSLAYISLTPPLFLSLELGFSHRRLKHRTLAEEEPGRAIPNTPVSIYCSTEWEENLPSPSTTRCFKHYICPPELKGK